MEELFRFVLVRPPEPPKDIDVVSLRADTELQGRLVAAGGAEDPRGAVIAILSDFASKLPRPFRLAQKMAKADSYLALQQRLVKEAKVPRPSSSAQPAWAPWTKFAVHDAVSYKGSAYECIQAHTSQPDWPPDAVPALWRSSGGTSSDDRQINVAAIVTELLGQSPEDVVRRDDFRTDWLNTTDWLIAAKLTSRSELVPVDELGRIARTIEIVRRVATAAAASVAAPSTSSAAEPPAGKSSGGDGRGRLAPDQLEQLLTATLVLPPEIPLLAPLARTTGGGAIALRARTELASAATLAGLDTKRTELARIREMLRMLEQLEPFHLSALPAAAHYEVAGYVGGLPNLSAEMAAVLKAQFGDIMGQLGIDFSRSNVLDAHAQLADRARALAAEVEAVAPKPAPGGGSGGDPAPLPIPETHGALQPVGIGDLLVVRHQIKGYEAGEIAHIENVMAKESRLRSHRTLQRTEEIVEVEKETQREEERDLRSVDRFELKSETSEVLKEDHHLDVGVAVSAKFGENIELKTHANYKYDRAKEEASKRASTYAKEVTERAASKVVEKSRERRQTTRLSEVEENNKHGFENTGNEHVVGIYQFVNKIYESQTFNYGQRVLFDVMLPEPAAFLVDALTVRKPEGDELVKPDDFALLPSQLDITNYEIYVARYRATGVAPPPPLYQIGGFTVSSASDKNNDGKPFVIEKTDIQVPAGWKAVKAFVRSEVLVAGDDAVIMLTLGGGWRWFEDDGKKPGSYQVFDMAGETGTVPLVLLGTNNVVDFGLTGTIIYQRLPAVYEKWQLDTHAKIVEAWLARRAEYQEKLAAKMIQLGFQGGRNPEQNRALERTEIKKTFLAILTAQNFDYPASIQENPEPPLYPQIGDFKRAQGEGEYARFFEHAFEWDAMTYVFYPYFWGRKHNWYQRATVDDADPIFAEFLRAGFARVVVPVRPGFQIAIMHFLETGQLWNGGPEPEIHSDLYVPIITEIKERERAPGKETPYGETWEVRVPTDLVRLRPDNSLPTWTKGLDGKWKPS